jgi:hypothetical protein
MSIESLPGVGNLIAVKLAGHLGVTGSPVEACLELAADAHRETAGRGIGERAVVNELRDGIAHRSAIF